MRSYALILSFLMTGITTWGQTLDKEITLDISGKAKRGYLGNVVVDDSREQIDLVFVTKSTNRLVKFEAYQFDYDLNLINSFTDEQEVEKAKSRWSWFNFKGESYSVEGITAEGNLLGKFVVKQKQISYGFSWWTGTYRKTVKTLGKVKFETPNGRKMWFISSYDNDQTGEVLALAGHQASLKEKLPYQHLHKMSLMRVNHNLELVSEEEINLDYPQHVIYSGGNNAIDPNSDKLSNWYVVFAPNGDVGKKNSDPVPNNYTVLEISPEGKVLRKVNFKSEVAEWLVNGIYAQGDEIYIYGPGNSKGVGDKYHKIGLTEEDKYSDIQIACIKGNAQKFVSANNVDEFKTNVQSTEDNKKPTYYNGKKVDIRSLYVAGNGDVFITAQDFRVDNGGNAQGYLYKDLMLFHFDNKGKLVTHYSLENDVKKGGIVGGGLADPRFHPATGNMIESADGKSLYWMLFIPYYTDEETETYNTLFNSYTVTTYIPKRYPKVLKIDLDAKKIASVEDYGNKEYFLREEYPSITIDGGSKVIFIGESKNGKSMWLGKLDPAKL